MLHILRHCILKREMTVLCLQRAKGDPQGSVFCLATAETPEKEDQHINFIDALQVKYKFSIG